MYFIWHIMVELIAGFLPLLPITILFHFILRKRNKKRGPETEASHLRAAYLLLLTFIAIFSAIGLPNVYTLTIDITVNFILFLDIFANMKQYIQNILLFIPFGFFTAHAVEEI
jgi:hypothetical protein